MDPCLTLITCPTTNWNLRLRSLDLSLNLSLPINTVMCGCISFASSPHSLHLILLILFSLQCGEKGAFQVVMDNYVKEEEGTGVVHQAPYFGTVSVVILTDFMLFFNAFIFTKRLIF